MGGEERTILWTEKSAESDVNREVVKKYSDVVGGGELWVNRGVKGSRTDENNCKGGCEEGVGSWRKKKKKKLWTGKTAETPQKSKEGEAPLSRAGFRRNKKKK